ncbi:hypothetical protein ArV2_gp28 [Arthrobacter phage vB_ArS-ArV2]|uniref:Uncharacterized protein n=1 Tax=Arthrobacter phage vB_ArS-ArV2 TaxID=1414742 RepID=V5RBD9_9CAUD|nr:hypothetical protein ArV2_gp28 [Arthrobacter phage vB_ArS-ArV2]AHB31639.1 hypothetical protein ArV2_gp28 [Arthrobacter phage vB_ArS-ArV2]
MVGVDDLLERMRRESALRVALGRAPGADVQKLDPRPLVRVRAVYGRAVAASSTHVLHEWVRWGDYHCRWDEKWQVHRVTAEEWHGEPID